MPGLGETWALPVALLAIVNISATWYKVVSGEVAEPYLDEFFHVPQAQKYCDGDYTWDPKITTPPGLYLVAKLFKPLIGCEIASLRALNVGALCLICPLCYGILRVLRMQAFRTRSDADRSGANKRALTEADASVAIDAHSALSIALFPPLFFFSALFYTDVMSTLAVLLSYSVYLKKSTAAGSIFDNVIAVLIGIIALLFRQTNIFWVAVFPAGLTVIETLQAVAGPSTTLRPTTFVGVMNRSWTEGYIHDRTVDSANFGDYVFLFVSLPIAALRNLVLVARAAIPYVVLLSLFAGFVIWNGSVVLGDKTAHTATLHLPQMLYIWPYIAFFSAPLLITPLLRLWTSLVPTTSSEVKSTQLSVSSRISFVNLLRNGLCFIALATAVVHYNTIIHPYTLADNRHYVFYVFRILRRHSAIRYAAIPVYYVGAWLTMQALALSSNEQQQTNSKRNVQPTNDNLHRSPCKISFVSIWLVTTALSVVTAPLVEPRYFILPWVIWRLHVPLNASLSAPGKTSLWIGSFRSIMETAWQWCVDIAVSYIFIRWTFEWPNEPGKLQRFLW